MNHNKYIYICQTKPIRIERKIQTLFITNQTNSKFGAIKDHNARILSNRPSLLKVGT